MSQVFSELLAARRIARQILEAARDPLAPALASAGSRAPSIPPGTPDVETREDVDGLTTFDGLFDGDFFDTAATFS